MRLTYLYEPVDDIAAATDFYRAELGWEEAWREGEDTVAFWTPDRSVQVMLSLTDQPAGPMYAVNDLAAWMTEHNEIHVAIAPYDIPGGSVGGFRTSTGYVFYVFDQRHRLEN